MKENQRENDLSRLNKLLLLVFVAVCAAAFDLSNPEIKDSWIGRAINKLNAFHQERLALAFSLQSQAATTDMPPKELPVDAAMLPVQKSGTSQPLTLATLKSLTPVINGVTGSAELKAGKAPSDGMNVTVHYSVPLNQRVCITMTPYETIRPNADARYAKDLVRGCIDRAPGGKVNMNAQLLRSDVPDSAMERVLNEAASGRELPDGFMLVNLQVGNEVQIDRIDSPFFARDAVKTIR